MITSPLLSDGRHRAMITPISPLLTRLIQWELSIGLDFISNVPYKSIASKNIQSDINYFSNDTCLHRAARILLNKPE